MNELDLEEEALVPTTNFVISVHSSMWIFDGNGHMVRTYLYTTTMDDMVKYVLQQQFYHMFLFGNEIGTRPIGISTTKCGCISLVPIH
jgi:hypothetical protein